MFDNVDEWMKVGYGLLRDLIALHPDLEPNNERLALVTQSYESWRQQFTQMPQIPPLILFFLTLDSWTLGMPLSDWIQICLEVERLRRQIEWLICDSLFFAALATGKPL